MKHLKKNLLLLLMISTISSFSQSSLTMNARVTAVINLAYQDYAIINVDGTNDYYQTSPYNAGELIYNQAVTLVASINGNFQVNASTLTANVFADLISNSNNTNKVELADIKLPILENGILIFNSRRDYDNIYTLIDEYMNTGEYDEMLDNIERNAIGFTSFRTWLNNEFKYRDGNLPLTKLKNYHKSDFVNDIIIKTLLNENRLVGINDTIYQYFSKGIVLSTLRGNNLGVNFMNTFRIGDDITNTSPRTFANTGIIVKSNTISYPILPVFPHNNGSGGLEYTPMDPVMVDSLFGTVTVSGQDSLRYTTTIYKDAPNCNPSLRYLQITLDEEVYDTITASWPNLPFFFSGTATVIIDWDDNSPLQTISNYSWTDIPHNYPASNGEQDYYPTVTTIFTDSNGDVDTIVDGNGTGGQDFYITAGVACISAAVNLWQDVISPDNNWLMHTELWVTSNPITSHIGSSTHSYEASGNAWSQAKSDIWCMIDGKFRETDCSFKVRKYDTKHKNLSKSVQKTKSKLWHVYKYTNGEVFSGHYMNKGAYHLEYTNVLSPC